MKAKIKATALISSLFILTSFSAQAHSADNLSLSAHWQAHLMLAGAGVGAIFLLRLGIKRLFAKSA